MPNLVEAFTAIHACNRIGAIYTVLFSGFGRDAVASRLAAARASVVVVADAIYRRGKPVPLLETLRAARPDAPTLRHTVVVDRTGDGVPLGEDETSYRELVAAHPEGSALVPLDPNEPGVPDLHQRHRVAPQGRRALRRRLPAGDLGERALAGRR